MQRKLYLLLTAVFLITIKPTVAQPKVENALFWEVSGKNLSKPSYLFGTYHLINGSFLNELPAVEKAFINADGLAVEMVIDSAQLPMMQSKMMMPGKKISDMVKPEEAKLISDEMTKVFGAGLPALDQMKPMTVSLLLTINYAQKVNQETLAKYTGLPLDQSLIQKSKTVNKPIFTFETMMEQIDLLYNALPVEKQAEQLAVFIKDIKGMETSQKVLLESYIKQDFVTMHQEYAKYEKQFGNSDYMLADRNVKWMTKLPELLSKGNQFIAVGALHLQGKKGIVTLLKENGYTVKPVSVK